MLFTKNLAQLPVINRETRVTIYQLSKIRKAEVFFQHKRVASTVMKLKQHGGDGARKTYHTNSKGTVLFHPQLIATSFVSQTLVFCESGQFFVAIL